MHPLLRALLGPWTWRPEILVVLIPLGILYTIGWRRMRRQSTHGKLATWPRLAAYLGGLTLLATALMSPIDRLGSQLFFMHMVQHLITMMLAAPLLWLGNPFPFMLWALPDGARRQVGSLFTRNAPFRRLLAGVTRPGVAWIVFLTVYLGWHDPNAYNLALYHGWVHDLQHITFFGAAMLYWWPVIDAAPRIRSRLPGWGKLIYLIGVIPPNMFISVSIAFAQEVMYTYYESVPRIWGFTIMQDQQISGAIMWIPGSMMFIAAALIVLAKLFQKEAQRPLPDSKRWNNEETMIAPGLEDRVVQNRWRKLQRVHVRHGSRPTSP